MRNLTEFMVESLNEAEEAKIKELEKKVDAAEEKAEKAAEKADDAEKEAGKAEESIKDEKTFRDYAENKFKEVFGDELDEKKMKDTIDGILADNKAAIDKGDWGKIIGILNKSFGGK